MRDLNNELEDMKIKKHAGGRPTVMTPEVIAKLEQAFAIDATNEEACSYADISRDSLYDYVKKNPEFSNRIADLRQRPVLKARQTVVKALDNPETALKYLERKRKGEFSVRQEQDISIDGVGFLLGITKPNEK